MPDIVSWGKAGIAAGLALMFPLVLRAGAFFGGFKKGAADIVEIRGKSRETGKNNASLGKRRSALQVCRLGSQNIPFCGARLTLHSKRLLH